MYENRPFPLGKMRRIDRHLIDVSVLSANPIFVCTGERIIQKPHEFGQAGIQLDSSPVFSGLRRSRSRLRYQNKRSHARSPASYAG